MSNGVDEVGAVDMAAMRSEQEQGSSASGVKLVYDLEL